MPKIPPRRKGTRQPQPLMASVLSTMFMAAASTVASNVADMPAIDAVYREFFEAPYPNRSSMGISALVVPGMKLEIVAYAMLP